jgi:hypothetical protein
MNLSRLLLIGLVAGLFFVVSGMMVSSALFGAEMVKNLKSLGSPVHAGDLLSHIGLRLLSGMLCAWLYVLVRPRFGAGPRTAVVAGLTAWLALYPYCVPLMVKTGVLSAETAWITSAWGAIEHVLATLAGARVYRE